MSLIDEGVMIKKQKNFWTCRDSSESCVEVPVGFQGSQDLLGQQCLHNSGTDSETLVMLIKGQMITLDNVSLLEVPLALIL